MASTFTEMVAIEKGTEPGVYHSRRNPEKMGNAAPIAYGGCALAIAIVAAYETVQPSHQLYSAQGNFLGPALTDRPLSCSVQEKRTTRTFATRIVEVGQRLDNGQSRSCLLMVADFHVPEPASMLTYSKPRPEGYSSYEECKPAAQWRQSLVDRGVVSQGVADAYAKQFSLGERFYENRPCPEGVAAQNLYGMAKTMATTQDSRALIDKSSADWFKYRHKLSTKAEHAAAVIFQMDAALAFIALTYSHMFLDDAGACSSLDFSLRILVAEADMNEWHLRELKTVAGGNGRTYGENQLWDRSGKMVATMTQQGILRPPRPKM